MTERGARKVTFQAPVLSPLTIPSCRMGRSGLLPRCYWLSGRCCSGYRRGLVNQRPRPGRAEQGQDIAVEAVVAGDTPGQDQEERQEAQDGVGTHRTGQQVVHVHEHTEEGGDAGQDAQDQRHADEDFPEGHHIGEQSRVGQHYVLQESGIPALHGRMRSTGLGQCSHHEAFDGGPVMGAEDPGAAYHFAKGGTNGEIAPGQLLQTGGQPFIANIQTDNQPEPRHAGVGEQEPRNRRFRNLGYLFWANRYRVFHCLLTPAGPFTSLSRTALKSSCSDVFFHLTLLAYCPQITARSYLSRQNHGCITNKTMPSKTSPRRVMLDERIA